MIMEKITIKVPEISKVSLGTTETSKLRKDINAHVADKSNPHDVTKAQLGLGNVDNVKQASKADFNLHKDDMTAHVMDTERNNWNDKYTRAEVDRTFEDFDGHVWSIIDESINESKDSLTTYVDEKNQASKADFDSHKNAEELDHPDNSVTYNKLSLEVQQMIESNDELIVAENFSELDKLNDIVILNTHEENVDFNNAIVFTNVGHEGTDYYQIALEYDVGNEGVVNVWSRKFNTQITQGSKWSKVLSKDEIITKLDEKNSEQDDAIDSNTITETAEGSAINITDSANAKLKGLKIYGKSKQFTTTGNNLMSNDYETSNPKVIYGVTFTKNSDGSITISGANDGNGNSAYRLMYDNGNTVLTLPSGTYHMIPVNGLPTNNKFDLILYDGTTYYSINGDSSTSITFTKETSFTNIYLQIGKGDINTYQSLTVYPMLSTIPITIEDYEPYTGGKSAPNPNYPQEIVNIGDGGSITTDFCGGNLFDTSKLSKGSNATLNISEDTYTITVVGGATRTYTSSLYTLEIEKLKGKTICFSLDDMTRSQEIACGPQITITKEDGSRAYYHIASYIGTLSRTIEIPETAQSVSVGIYTNNTSTALTADNTVVVKGLRININEDAGWESYQAQTATFSTPNGLPGVPVTSGGNYTDENGQQYICDEIDGDSYIHRVVKYTFDGSENWSYSTSGVSSFRLSLPDIVNYSTINIANPMLCTHYPVESSNAVYSGLDKCATIYGQIWISDSRYTDLNSWKSALSELNLSAIFILKEPIEEPLADNEILVYKALRTNKTVTNIFNDVNAHMKIDYVADPKTYIDNKFAKVENAILSLGGNV